MYTNVYYVGKICLFVCHELFLFVAALVASSYTFNNKSYYQNALRQLRESPLTSATRKEKKSYHQNNNISSTYKYIFKIVIIIYIILLLVTGLIKRCLLL